MNNEITEKEKKKKEHLRNNIIISFNIVFI